MKQRALLPAVLLLVLAGCSSGGSGPAGPSESRTAATPAPSASQTSGSPAPGTSEPADVSTSLNAPDALRQHVCTATADGSWSFKGTLVNNSGQEQSVHRGHRASRRARRWQGTRSSPKPFRPASRPTLPRRTSPRPRTATGPARRRLRRGCPMKKKLLLITAVILGLTAGPLTVGPAFAERCTGCTDANQPGGHADRNADADRVRLGPRRTGSGRHRHCHCHCDGETHRGADTAPGRTNADADPDGRADASGLRRQGTLRDEVDRAEGCRRSPRRADRQPGLLTRRLQPGVRRRIHFLDLGNGGAPGPADRGTHRPPLARQGRPGALRPSRHG